MTKSEKNRWNKLKKKGSEHYKTLSTEPLDLIKSGGMLRDFAIASIIKYAFRNRSKGRPDLNPKDLDKIIHYTEVLQALYLESQYKKGDSDVKPNSPS